MELDNLLWQDASYLEVKKLWHYLSCYCYLPRLADYRVLEAAIARGVESDQYFGYAAAVAENRYIDLKFNEPAQIEKSGFIVRRSAAIAQLEAEAAEKARKMAEEAARSESGAPQPAAEVNESGQGYGGVAAPLASPAQPRLTRFYLDARLDNSRINRDVDRIVAEVLNHIAQDGSLEIRLEVEAHSPEGFEQQTIRTASENCRALKIERFGFEEE